MKSLYKLLLTLLSMFLHMGVFAQPNDNVVAYYPFNGSASDVTGNGKDGSVNGATLTIDRLGKPNAAYFFNGRSSLIYLPNALLPNASAFAISCWVKPMGNNTSPDTYNAQEILDLRGQYQIALSCYEPNHASTPNTSASYIYSSPVSAIITAPTNSLPVGTWRHLLCNYGNNLMEYYVDGVLVGTYSIGVPGPVSGYNNTIGKDYNVGWDRLWFYGAIDEVLFYSRKLTSSEVTAIYNQSLVYSEISELYGPVSFNYDGSGNRINRQCITLKSGSYIHSNDSISSNINYSILIPPQEETLREGKVLIYPNPTKGILKVELTGFESITESSIKLYKENGTKLLETSAIGSSNLIDLSSYSNGIYILKVVVGDNVSEWKIIKE